MNCRVCGIQGPDKFSKAASEWDWFTGYLSDTVHFCPLHRRSSEYEELLRLSKVRPAQQG